MYFLYEGHSKLSGIYEIRNRYSNRSYIRQAKEFKERWKQHKTTLIKNRTQNKFLQKDFNKCKEILENDNFLEFHILEIMENSTKEERNIQEEYWIKLYKENEYQLYNVDLTPTKGSKVWCHDIEKFKQKLTKKSKKIITETERKRLSEISKKNWENPEFREKMSENARGSKNYFYGKSFVGENHPFYGKHHTEETKHKLSKLNKGKQHTEESKKKMSRKGKLNPMYGKHVSEKIKEANKLRFQKTYNVKIMSPEGIIYGPITNAISFGKEHGIYNGHFYEFLKKKIKYHKGWKLIE